jgi:hypothetical protein
MCNRLFRLQPSFTQSLFSATENVTALSVGTTIPPTVIGTRITVQKAGFITGIRWFRVSLNDSNDGCNGPALIVPCLPE